MLEEKTKGWAERSVKSRVGACCINKKLNQRRNNTDFVFVLISKITQPNLRSASIKTICSSIARMMAYLLRNDKEQARCSYNRLIQVAQEIQQWSRVLKIMPVYLASICFVSPTKSCIN